MVIEILFAAQCVLVAYLWLYLHKTKNFINEMMDTLDSHRDHIEALKTQAQQSDLNHLKLVDQFKRSQRSNNIKGV